MNKLRPFGIQPDAPPSELEGGEPSGSVLLIAVPQLTYVAFSDVAARRGMTVTQAISKALHDFCAEPV